MGHLRSLPGCHLEEPEVLFNNSVVPIKGQPSNFSQATILTGNYGKAVITIDKEKLPAVDFYGTGKFTVQNDETNHMEIDEQEIHQNIENNFGNDNPESNECIENGKFLIQ